MKGTIMSMSNRLLTRLRAIIETVNDELKNTAQVEHSSLRSFYNFVVNLLGAFYLHIASFPRNRASHVKECGTTN